MKKTKIWKIDSWVCSMACDRELVAVGLVDGNMEIREIISGGRVRGWKGHDKSVRTLFFTSDGRLVSGSWDGLMKKWDVETETDDKSAPKELWSRNVGVREVQGVSELADGRLVVGGTDWSVRVLEGVTGLSIGEVCRGHTDLVRAVVSLGDVDAGLFASGSNDGTIRVWASTTEGGTTSPGTMVRVVEVGQRVFSLSLSPCGPLGQPQRVAAGCSDGSVKLYRLPDWDLVWKDGSVKAHEDTVFSVSWSPDGRFLASGSKDRTVKILSADTGATLRTLRGHANSVNSVLFSQDGTKVLSGSLDCTVRVWRLCEHDDRIASLLSDCSPSDLIYEGKDVFYHLFKNIRQKLIV